VREQGRIAEWNDDRGFGFITPLNGGPRVFAHVSEFPSDLRRPEALDLVTYELGQDDRGRHRASRVTFLTPTAARASQQTSGSGRVDASVAVTIAVLTVVILMSGLAIGSSALALLLGYLVVSTATYFAYAMDKSAAQRGAYRTQESALHLLAFAGGWPGALVAQQHFHHKTRKQPFRTIFWATVVLNVVMLVIIIGMLAVAPS